MVYTITESLLNEIIDVLEFSKRPHYSDYAGLYSCDFFFGRDCDCGADETNEKIDALIEKLEKDFDTSNFILCAK